MNIKALLFFRDNFYDVLKRTVRLVDTFRYNIEQQEMIINACQEKLKHIGDSLPKITLEQTKEIEVASILMRSARSTIASLEDELVRYEQHLEVMQLFCEHDCDTDVCIYCTKKLSKEHV